MRHWCEYVRYMVVICNATDVMCCYPKGCPVDYILICGWQFCNKLILEIADNLWTAPLDKQTVYYWIIKKSRWCNLFIETIFTIWIYSYSSQSKHVMPSKQWCCFCRNPLYRREMSLSPLRSPLVRKSENSRQRHNKFESERFVFLLFQNLLSTQKTSITWLLLALWYGKTRVQTSDT